MISYILCHEVCSVHAIIAMQLARFTFSLTSRVLTKNSVFFSQFERRLRWPRSLSMFDQKCGPKLAKMDIMVVVYSKIGYLH
jgi:hypothetical protein